MNVRNSVGCWCYMDGSEWLDFFFFNTPFAGVGNGRRELHVFDIPLCTELFPVMQILNFLDLISIISESDKHSHLRMLRHTVGALSHLSPRCQRVPAVSLSRMIISLRNTLFPFSTPHHTPCLLYPLPKIRPQGLMIRNPILKWPTKTLNPSVDIVNTNSAVS